MTIVHSVRLVLLAFAAPLFLSGCDRHAMGDKKTTRHDLETTSEETIHTGKLSGNIELAGHCGNTPSIQPDACQAKPFTTEVLVFRQSDNRLIQRVRSDEAGHFALELAPDVYRIIVEASRFITPTEQTVRLLPGDHRHIVLSLYPGTF